jgi:hypothetical protein
MTPLRLTLASLLALVLAACGSGGGGSEEGGGGSYSITVSHASVNLTMALHHEPPPEMRIKVDFVGEGLITGLVSDKSDDWLQVNPYAPGTYGNRAEFTLLFSEPVDPAGPGVYRETLRFLTGKADGSVMVTKDIPITITVTGAETVQPHVIYAGQNGIALSKLTNLEKLSQTVAIYDNLGNPGMLTATSNQGWLSTSTSGASVTVTADPTGLGEGMHYATVMVSSQASDAPTPTSIEIGLYVSTAAANTSSFPTMITSLPRSQLTAVDPIRPRLYVSDSSTAVHAYNFYTGTLEGSYSLPGMLFTNLTPSSDGKWLYAAGYDSVTSRIYRLNLATGTWSALASSPQAGIKLYARPNGKPMLIMPSAVLDAETGAYIHTGMVGGRYGSAAGYALSEDQKRLALTAPTLGWFNYSVALFGLDYAPAGDILTYNIIAGTESSQPKSPLVMNRAGTRLAAGGSILDYDATSATLTPAATLNPYHFFFYQTLVTRAGALYGASAGRSSPTIQPAGLYVYDASHTQVDFQAAPIGHIFLSGDEQRLVKLTYDEASDKHNLMTVPALP